MKTLLIALLFVAACGPSASKEQKESQRCQEICSKISMVAVGLAFFPLEEHATCVCQPI